MAESEARAVAGEVQCT